LSEFYKDKSRLNGYDCRCKECAKARSRKNSKKNPDYMKNYNREWLNKNPNYKKEWREKNPNYLSPCRIENPNYHNEYMKKYMNNRYKIDSMFRLNHNMANGICKSLKSNKNGSWLSLILYTLEQLKEHLENLFLLGMTWENYGKWHIDHLIPLSLWRFEKAEDREFKQCWALANLQPLWGKDNLIKGNKVYSII